VSDQLITVARYTDPLEAQLALGRLREEGIQAFLTGDNSVSVFTGTGLGGDHQLQVTEADRERAEQVLADFARDRDLDRHAALEEADAAIWVCPLCGDAVADHLAACPACATPRDAPEGAIQKEASRTVRRPPRRQAPAPEEGIERQDLLSPEAPGLPEQVEGESDLQLPPLETFLGDDLARRAMLAALFGPFTVGLGTLYSCWLLVKLFLYSGELSPSGMRKLYLAILLNGLFSLVWCGVPLRLLFW
jgi:hypothetical protein